MQQLQDLRVSSIITLSSPRELKEKLPVTNHIADTVCQARHEIEDILTGKDSRMLVIVGPCSIHDIDAAKEYASRLVALREELQEEFCIVMRVYFEKPRTTVGWKGFINDPHLNDTYDIEHGLFHARKLLIELNELGLPASTEFLDPITPQYVADLISWANYDAENVTRAEKQLQKAKLSPYLLVDCSHANSGKKFGNQVKVWEDILAQKESGNKSIAGVMIESNICSGNQPIPDNREELQYGVSITDECVSWEETAKMLRDGADFMKRISATV